MNMMEVNIRVKENMKGFLPISDTPPVFFVANHDFR